MTNTIQRYVLMLEMKERQITGVLCVFVLLFGVFYSFSLGSYIPYIDALDFYTIGQNIATKQIFSSDGEQPTAWRAPGYPVFLSLPIFLGANVLCLRLLNFVALAISLYLLRTMVKALVSPLAGLMAAALVIGYPVLLYTAGTLFSVTIGSFLFVCILFLLSKTQTGSARSFVPIGFLFGCLILTIPTFLFALVIVTGWVLFCQREARIRSSLALVLPALFLLLPWTIRNYTVFHSFILVTTNVGSPLLMGNSETTDVTRWNGNLFADHALEIVGMNEAERESYFVSKAVEFITENKRRALNLYCAKLLQYFNFRNPLYEESEASVLKDMIMLFTYGPLLTLFVVRLLFLRRFRPSSFELLLITLYLASAFVYALFLPRIRYRLPFDVLPIVVVSMFIGNLITALLKNHET